MFDQKSPLPARPSHWPYREAVGVVVVNQQDLVLVGKCRGFKDIWKMPQGGVKNGEIPLQAAKRELLEETHRKAVFERRSLLETSCEYPDGSRYMPGFKGQKFEWFLAYLDETPSNPRKAMPATQDQEFDLLRWVTPQEAIALAHNNYGGDHVTFQRQKIYQEILSEFGLLSPETEPERSLLKRQTHHHKPTS